jgi:hypothetical protein
MDAWLKKIQNSRWGVPLALFVACIICYGLLLPGLGFYWDDLPYNYSYHINGPMGYVDFVARDRPFSHYWYILTSFLFRETPLGYHLVTFILRWFSAVGVWWTLKVIWPKYSQRLIWVPFLFLVYPGFRQQPIPIIYGLHWVNYVQIIFSLGFMALAARLTGRKYWVWTGLALLLACSVFSLEYFFGLELVRPAILWVVLSETIPSLRKRAWAVAKQWVPYLVVMAAYVLWRVVLFKSNMYQPSLLEEVRAAPQSGLLGLAQTVFRDFFQVIVFAWQQVYQQLFTLQFESRMDLLYWGVVILGGLATAAYLVWLAPKELDEVHDNRFYARQVVLVGIWAVLAAGLPFWSSFLPVEIRFPYDRFTYPFMLGVSLVLGGLLEWLVYSNVQKAILVSIAVGFAFGWHFQNTNTYRRDWNNLSSFIWQFTWRVPGMQPGTIALTHELPLQYYTDYSLTPLLNWIYAPESRAKNLPYLMYFVKARLGGSLSAIAPDTKVNKNFRSFDFSGNTSQSFVFYYSPPGCLRVLDPKRSHELPDVPVNITDILSLSKPELILPDAQPAAQPVARWFNPEPSHDWCYYFEKADLARQKQDWQTVLDLYGQAQAAQRQPGEVTEQAVFMEGLARGGQFDQTGQLLLKSQENFAQSGTFLCAEWKYLNNELKVPAGQRSAWLETGSRLGCR